MLPFAFLAGLLRGHVARLDAELRARLEELRASRARLVEAGDTERRRLERNLHDGAQRGSSGSPSCSAAPAAGSTPTRPIPSGLLDQAQAELQAGLAELRELARGIHPPVLTEQGLAGAPGARRARTGAGDARRRPRERLPAPVEIAAYFVVAEALANVGKTPRRAGGDVAVRRDNGRVRSRRRRRRGRRGRRPRTGLRGLTDRVEALDGTLAVDSPSGGGTRLHVEIPCGEAAQSPAATRRRGGYPGRQAAGARRRPAAGTGRPGWAARRGAGGSA